MILKSDKNRFCSDNEFRIASELGLENNYRNYCSLPFSQVLEKSIKAFPFNITLLQANKEIEKLQAMDIDRASDYFANLNIESIADYWYYFYLLSNVALKGRRFFTEENEKNELIFNSSNSNRRKCKDYNINVEWEMSKENITGSSQTQDEFYKVIFNREQEFMDKLLSCKKKSLYKIKNEIIFKKKKSNLDYRSSKGNDTNNLNTFKQTLQFRKLIQTLPFYRKLDREFPKGILTHIHWPAAFTGKTVYKAFLDVIRSKNKSSKSNYALVKVNLLRVSKISPKIYLDIPTTFYFVIDKLSQLKNRKLILLKYERLFLEEYIDENKQCLTFPKKGISHEISDINIRAFLYFKHCGANSKIFLDFDYSIEENLVKVFTGIVNLKNIKGRISQLRSLYIRSLLEESRFFHENQKELIKKYLPAVYSNNMNLSYTQKLETSVWFKFENIFMSFENIIYHKEVFIKLNEHLRKTLLEQKIKGIEIRIWNQGNIVHQMNKILLNQHIKQPPKDDCNNMSHRAKDLKVGYIFYGVKNKISDCTKEIIKCHEICKNHNNSQSIEQDEIINKDLFFYNNQCSNLIGIDYVGFEDDPFTGARNFFHNTIQIQNNSNNKSKVNQTENNNNENNKLTHKEDQDEENFFEKLFLHLKKNSDLPLFYHAGETNYFPECPVDDEYLTNNYINDNLFHAILLPNLKRIGHGFASIKNDLLLEIIRKKNIPLEFSPLSNQDLFYYNVEANPILKLIRKGYPITVNSDDPGIFGYEGVTMDWFYLIMNTGLKTSDMYLLVKNSLIYSGMKLEKEEFEFILKDIQNDFLKFFQDLECGEE